MNIPVRIPNPFVVDPDEAHEIALNWAHKPSPLAWSVMLYGGTNPRTGFPQPQLEFQFYAGHFTRERIEQRAADMAEREHRTHWAVREPERTSDERLSFLSRGQRKFGRESRA